MDERYAPRDIGPSGRQLDRREKQGGACGLARSCGLDSWDALLDAVLDARHCVARGWAQVFDIQLEIA